MKGFLYNGAVSWDRKLLVCFRFDLLNLLRQGHSCPEGPTRIVLNTHSCPEGPALKHKCILNCTILTVPYW